LEILKPNTTGFNCKKKANALVKFFSSCLLTFELGILFNKLDDINLNITPENVRDTLVNNFFFGKFGVKEAKNNLFSLGFHLTGYSKFSIFKILK
jgi:hypothetical protein